MQPAHWSWLARSSTGLLVAIAASVAWIEGGGADARARIPRSDSAAPVSAAPGPSTSTSEAYEVKSRLLERLGDAVIDVPSLAASRPAFDAYWRKLRGPWLHPPGVAGELVTTIALRTSAEAETQWAVPTQEGLSWTPDVHVWNMNEGSFDQREAIFAPTPSMLVFRVTVPAGGRLRFSPAVATYTSATTFFDVTVADATGDAHLVSETRVAPGDTRHWLDVDADLAPWAGRRIDLKLQARSLGALETTAGASLDHLTPQAPALALWGDPVLVARERTRAPYNVLWFVVDAMRPDIAASLHDSREDAAKLAAPRPPLDALLPAIPGLMPGVDALAARGVHFTHAWSAAAWTRPGTLAMLAGERSSEIGIDTTNWVQPPEQVSHYYASQPPLLSRLLRKTGVLTAAFVNNFFMTGYANVGLDMGFETITDHRYRTRDTALIAEDASAWLGAHANERFFLFVNFNSPHEPYDPPREMLARIPPPPAGPHDGQVRAYMAEAAKDDAAIESLLARLDTLGLTRSTLVVLCSDHGETLSAAHDGFGFIGSDKMPLRFHHAVGNFEETARVPVVMALPGVIDGGRAVDERIRSIDIAPTILELEGLEADPRMSGRSVLGLARGRKEAEPRAVVTEGRLSRALLWGNWHLVVHDAPAHPSTQTDGGKAPPVEDELYDLEQDPGERRNVARVHADVVEEMRARLTAALANVPTADARVETTPPLPVVRFRFAGAGRAHRVAGTLTAGDDRRPARVTLRTAGIPPENVRSAGAHADFTLTTSPDAVVGFDALVDPPGVPLTWRFSLDDEPWPDDATFAGPFGLRAVAAKEGIATDEARTEAYSSTAPVVDPARDLGVFVTRDKADRTDETAWPAPDSAAAKEMQRVLQDWGYAHGSH